MREERRQEMLEMYDADGDGRLSDEERAALREARVADVVARMDQDADGRLTREELAAAGARRPGPPLDFDALDTDQDGYVSVEEMAAARPLRAGRERRGPGPRGPRGGGDTP